MIIHIENEWREGLQVLLILNFIIYLCRDLPAADKEGTSDPFIRIWDTVPEEKKTAVIEDNTNPLYYEVVEHNEYLALM